MFNLAFCKILKRFTFLNDFNIKEVLNEKICITKVVLSLAPPNFTLVGQQKSSEN